MADDDVHLPPYLWLIPHTHWDREWYEPHDVFRARLVAMLDALLDTLEREPEYRFTLDGQSAAIEDYLEIRPEAEDRVRAAVARGQLELGPFQILLDEFACDGETIVRNLEHGIRAARRYGPELRVGYLPDMFGHAAQMPQFLRGFGIADASLWRGAPARVDVHAFVWEALNGDAVRVEYQWDGYGSALKLLEPVAAAPQLIAAYVRENAAWFRGEPVAGMFGTDHMAPRGDLAEIVRAYNAAGSPVPLRIGTIGEVIAARDHGDEALAELPIVVGEMRSHARGNLLPGVFSIRTGMKAAMADAERALTTAERLDAVLPVSGRAAASVGSGGGVGRDLRAFFERGWGLAIESTAHDSVTGCGADSTAVEVETRLRVAEQTAAGALDLALRDLAACVPEGSLAVFNQVGVERVVLAEVTVEGALADLPAECQAVRALPTVIGDERIASADLEKVVRRIHGQEYFGRQLRGWTWDDEELVFEVGETADGSFELAEFVATLRRKSVESPSKVWRVRCVVPESHRVLVAGRAPALGIVALPIPASAGERQPTAAAGADTMASVEVRIERDLLSRHSARSEARSQNPGRAPGIARPGPATGARDELRDRRATISNGLVSASVRADGLVDVSHEATGARIEGALGLVDEADCGDSYNYGPVEGSAITTPGAVEIEVLERGPLRAVVRIRRTYELSRHPARSDAESQDPGPAREIRRLDRPSALGGEAREPWPGEPVAQLVDTYLELRAGEDFLRVTVRLVNAAPNHRLRVLIPTRYPMVETSASAGQYGVTERGRTSEGGWGEFPLPTFPAYRWVHAGGVTALVKKLTEYEVISDRGDAVALTVLRAVGMMSVNVHPLRDEPAGSEVPVPGAQYLGREVSLDFAIDLSAPHWDAPSIMANSERFRFDPVIASPTVERRPGAAVDAPRLDPAGGAHDDSVGTGPNDTSAVLESLRRVDDGIEARFANYSRSPQPLRFRADGEWRLTDMTGTPLGPDTPVDTWNHVAPAGAIVTIRTEERER